MQLPVASQKAVVTLRPVGKRISDLMVALEHSNGTSPSDSRTQIGAGYAGSGDYELRKGVSFKRSLTMLTTFEAWCQNPAHRP
jgi:hypothetical protein